VNENGLRSFGCGGRFFSLCGKNILRPYQSKGQVKIVSFVNKMFRFRQNVVLKGYTIVQKIQNSFVSPKKNRYFVGY
jgi:hypothetical protein